MGITSTKVEIERNENSATISVKDRCDSNTSVVWLCLLKHLDTGVLYNDKRAKIVIVDVKEAQFVREESIKIRGYPLRTHMEHCIVDSSGKTITKTEDQNEFNFSCVRTLSVEWNAEAKKSCFSLVTEFVGPIEVIAPLVGDEEKKLLGESKQLKVLSRKMRYLTPSQIIKATKALRFYCESKTDADQTITEEDISASPTDDLLKEFTNNLSSSNLFESFDLVPVLVKYPSLETVPVVVNPASPVSVV
eukprot:Platyproteum_vivax@DN334_c0_g1_i1.p1